MAIAFAPVRSKAYWVADVYAAVNFACKVEPLDAGSICVVPAYDPVTVFDPATLMPKKLLPTSVAMVRAVDPAAGMVLLPEVNVVPVATIVYPDEAFVAAAICDVAATVVDGLKSEPKLIVPLVAVVQS